MFSMRLFLLGFIATASACPDSPKPTNDDVIGGETVEDVVAAETVEDAVSTADSEPDGVDPDAATMLGRCGNGIRDPEEDCDGEDLGTATCSALGFSGGTLRCNAACIYEINRCEGAWTCPVDTLEPDNDPTVATNLTPGRHIRGLCAGDQDWLIFDTPTSGHDALTIYVYGTGREAPLTPEIWFDPDGEGPRFMVNVVDRTLLPGTERTTWHWAWSETMHEPRIGPRPARLYLRVRASGTAISLLYAVSHRTDIECGESLDCERGNQCEMGVSFTCVPGCGGEVAGGQGNPCPDGELCRDGQCVAPECMRHADCAMGRACIDQVCVDAPCSNDSDCPYVGLRSCKEDAGYCVECVAAEDCPFPESATCNDHRCGIACTDDAFAPNQTQATAAPIDVSTSFSETDLKLCGLYAEDWFRFTLDEARPVRITTRFTHADGDIDMKLFRAGETEPVGVAETNTDLERIVLESAASGTYELWVYFWPRPGDPVPPTRATQDYALSISTAPIECRTQRDCASDRVCVDFLCIETTCELDAACVAYGIPCDEGSGVCAECGADDDCGFMEVCEDRRCEPMCSNDPGDNVTRETASPVVPGTHDDILCKARGETAEAWFSVAMAAGETAVVTVASMDGWNSYTGQVQFARLELFRQDGTPIDWDVVGDGAAVPSWTAVASETMYVKVSAIQTGTVQAGPLAYRLTLAIDPECVPSGPFGSPSDGCESAEMCIDLMCIEGCNSNEDCPDPDVCNMGTCITPECATQADCPADASCLVRRFCVPAQPCDEDFDCTFANRSEYTNARHCAVDLGRCVECVEPGHCGYPTTCVNHACVVDCDDDAFEPNDTRATATPMTFGTYPDLFLCDVPADASDPRQRSDDWFVVELAEGEDLVAEIEWDAGQRSLEVEMFDAAGEPMGMSTVWGEQLRRMQANATTPGPVYVRVFRSTDLATTAYRMKLIRAECGRHSDCGLGEVCQDFACTATTCSNDDACFDYEGNYTCDEVAGFCRECATDNDCIHESVICRRGHCVLDCEPDAFEPRVAGADPTMISMPFVASALTLCGGFDSDLFMFELAANRTYTFRATPSTHGPEAISMSMGEPEPGAPFLFMPLATSAIDGNAQVMRFTTGPEAILFVLEVSWAIGAQALTYALTID